MKKNSKKLSLLLSLCLLICSFSFSANAVDEGMTATENTPYTSYTNFAGQELILNADGYALNQLMITMDIVIDTDPYNYGQINDFFGIQIDSIQKLFSDEFIDVMISRSGYIFGYSVILSNTYDIESAISILNEEEHILSVSQTQITDIEPDETEEPSYDAETQETGHYDLIGVATAWNKGFIGSSDIMVAVLDTGAVTNSEFDNNMRYDLGLNVVDNNEDITPTDEKPYHGHHVASIIGADFGDGGVNGICRNVSMLPIKIDGDRNVQYMAFSLAIGSGADIINLSWGCVNTDIVTLISNTPDVLVVTSAGNNGINIAQDSSQTAKLNNLNNWIVVGNSTLSDARRSTSNYSSTYVDIFAPGVDVPVVGLANGSYTTNSGTSFSAPMVSAAAALIMSRATHLSPAQVKNHILTYDDNASGLSGLCVSGGRLAIDKAVSALYTMNRGTYSKGDLNGSGTVTSTDYTLCYNYCMGTATLTSTQKTAADINGDGTVTTLDYNLIKRFVNQNYYFIP